MSAPEKKREAEGKCEGEPPSKRARKEDSPAKAAWKKMMNYVEPEPFKPSAKLATVINALRLVGSGTLVAGSEQMDAALATLNTVKEFTSLEQDEMMLVLSKDKELTASLKRYIEQVDAKYQIKASIQSKPEAKEPSVVLPCNGGECHWPYADDHVICAHCQGHFHEHCMFDHESTCSSSAPAKKVQATEQQVQMFELATAEQAVIKAKMDDAKCRDHHERNASTTCPICKGKFCSACAANHTWESEVGKTALKE